MIHRARLATLAAVVVLVSLVIPVGAEAHVASFHTHAGWTKNTVLEQFGITASELYIAEAYDQDTTVQRPTYANGYCYGSAFPIRWVILGCVGAPYYAPGSWSGVEAHATFYHVPTNVAYDLRAANGGYQNGGGWYGCGMPAGALPPFWSNQCAGTIPA